MSKKFVSRTEVPFAEDGENTFGLKVFREVWSVNGREKIFWKYGLPDSVQIFAMTTNGEVIAISEFQPSVGLDYLHLPGETFDPGETDPLVVADRGLLEEVGYQAGSRELLSSVLENSGRSDRLIHIVLMRECVKVSWSEPGIVSVLMSPDDFWTELLSYFETAPASPHGGGNTLKATALALDKLGFLRIP